MQGVVTYTIKDDLTVTPMSTISTITMLNAAAVRNLGDLQEKTVRLGYTEVILHLTLTLHSLSPALLLKHHAQFCRVWKLSRLRCSPRLSSLMSSSPTNGANTIEQKLTGGPPDLVFVVPCWTLLCGLGVLAASGLHMVRGNVVASMVNGVM